MSFNPDPSKPAQEVIFSRKLKTVPHPSITFNNNPLSLCPAQKHLGLVLDSKLKFNEHINHILSKVNKSIGLLRKFQSVLPRSSLLTVYKIFIRSHLDYADVVYRSSHRRCSVKKGSLGNFAKFTGTHLRQRLFFIKKESLAQVFSGEFCEISKNTGRLLLCS